MTTERANGTNGVNGTSSHELWHHPFPESTEMFRFMQTVNITRGLQLKSYKELYNWSIENVGDFWEEVWLHTGVKASEPYTQVGVTP